MYVVTRDPRADIRRTAVHRKWQALRPGGVLELVRSIGFRPIDAGPLVMARALEGMGLLLISLQIRNGWPWQNGWKIVGPTATGA